MAKNLDGIKKLNPAEAEQYRKIVLDYIGEKDAVAREKQKLSLSSPTPKRVDGVNLSKLNKENTDEQDRLNQAVKRQAEERERIKQEEKRHLLERERAEKERLKRRQAIRKFNKNLKLKFKKIFLAVKRNIVYILSLPVASLALAYVIFCLAVLRFNQYDIIKQAANYLPVPAVITSKGIISYNDFQRIKTSDYAALNLAGKKDSLLKWAVLENLREKYGLADNLEIKFVGAQTLDQYVSNQLKNSKIFILAN